MEIETVTDPVFGEMTFRHTWKGKTTLPWNGNTGREEIPVTLYADAYTGQKILPVQQECYSAFLRDRDRILDQMRDCLWKYCQRSYDSALTRPDFLQKVTPKSLLFNRDGTWGILFECPWDPEMDLAVKVSKGSFEAGPDELLI